MKFHELQVNDKFTYDNVEYIRIPDERISCCKVLNAKVVATNEKAFIVPANDVTKVD
jgi:hypothetical protein